MKKGLIASIFTVCTLALMGCISEPAPYKLAATLDHDMLHAQGYLWVVVLPDTNSAVGVGSFEGVAEARRLSLENGQIVWSVTLDTPVRWLELDQDSGQVVGLTSENVVVFDPDTGEIVDTIPLTANPDVLQWSPDGSSLAFYNREQRQLYLLDWRQRGIVTSASLPVPAELSDHVSELAVAPDNQVVAVGTFRGLVYFWDVTSNSVEDISGLLPPVEEASETTIQALALSPDNELAVVRGVGNETVLLSLNAEPSVRIIESPGPIFFSAGNCRRQGESLLLMSFTLDNGVYILDSGTGAYIDEFYTQSEGYPGIIWISNDCRHLVTAGEDDTSVWVMNDE